MLDSTTPISADRTAEPAAPAAPGLRERKKQRTRAAIVRAGLDLSEANGFDATTVEQIAAVADVSPRTVNRYFETKEDIVLAPVVDFGAIVAAALRDQPRTGDELHALCRAYLSVVDRAVAEEEGGPSFRQFQQMQRIMRASPAVNARALDYADTKNQAVFEELAERMDTSPECLTVRLIGGTWQVLCHLSLSAAEDVMLTGAPAEAARVARESILLAYRELRRMCSTSLPEDATRDM
ncbi:TetR family transcriptional regulator [Nocardia thailandica]|uniref:TetR family transcriptional regulator n=1 Tax=Nocardia thailandica TaxID=257275 RepID=A0ABW6PJW5_9NOCA|nr:TetR family transcriptional regulator [Nocardia thailandica]